MLAWAIAVPKPRLWAANKSYADREKLLQSPRGHAILPARGHPDRANSGKPYHGKGN